MFGCGVEFYVVGWMIGVVGDDVGDAVIIVVDVVVVVVLLNTTTHHTT